jgi:hypothetical protein
VFGHDKSSAERLASRLGAGIAIPECAPTRTATARPYHPRDRAAHDPLGATA